MPISTQNQLAFAGADYCSAPHLVDLQSVQQALNIDFELVPGAAAVRRGSVLGETFALSTSPVQSMFRNLNNPTAIFSSPLYVRAGGVVYRGVSGAYNSVAQTDGNDCWPAAYRQYTYIPAWGTSTSASVKDDGTTALDWVKQNPTGAPVLAVNTLTALAVTSTYTAVEGTTTGTGTYLSDATTFRCTLTATPISTNLNLNGTHTIGDYGVDCLDILFSDPTQVNRISRDYSIGDTSFINYWHTEFTDGSDPSAQPDAAVLIQSAISTATYLDSGGGPPTRDDMASEARTENRPTITLISSAANAFNLWACPRTKFDLINAASVPTGWTNIQAVRIVVECSSQIAIQVKNWQIFGATDYAKSDAQVGYTYYQTWATLDASGAILGESAPSPASLVTPIQNGQMVVTWSNTMTGTQHGITHALIYAQGGYLNDNYAVGTQTVLNTAGTAIAISTFTDTFSDIDTLTIGRIMVRNVMGRDEFNSHAFSLVGEPFNSRLFVASNNRLYWSMPGMPDVFPRTSYTDVSYVGDNIRGLIVWGQTLCIVNRDSVYEMRGSIFEGTSANWTLAKMACRHGGKAFGSIVKTPYGIPLMDYEGLFMYTPGQGIDTPIDWVVAQMGDLWKGNGGNDPAVLKGNRLFGLSIGFIDSSFACFANDKLYLAVVDDGATKLDTVWVINFRTQKVQMYQYPATISCLYFDQVGGRVLIGTTSGQVIQIETGIVDYFTAGVNQVPIQWKMTSRAWSVPTDNRLENIALDVESPEGSVVVTATYDGTSTATLGSIAATPRDWIQFPQTGTLSRDVVFGFSGFQAVVASNQTILHQMKWTALPEPERVRYLQTEGDDQGQLAENLWTAHYTDIEVIKTSTNTTTGTIQAVVYIDNVAVMTNTFAGPSAQGSTGREVLSFSFPWNTYGNIAHAVYTVLGATDCVFKLWGCKYASTPEPDRLGFVSSGITTYPSPNFMKTWVAELNPLGTCTGVIYLDDVAYLTNTFTGSGRQTFNLGLDLTAGAALQTAKKVEATYTASIGGHLKHYNTAFEVEAKPFSKKSWAVSFKKAGGATQLDMARFWSIDVEAPLSGATLTAVWTIDGVDQPTNTLVVAGRSWNDRIPFPPGGRGYLFQLRISATDNIEVFKANLDIEMVGVKGFSRRTYAGTPAPNA